MKNPQALCYNKFRLRTGDFLCAKVRNMCWKTGGSYMEKKKKSMKLRTRVIISFFIIILVPIVMCALTFYFFVGYKAKIIGEKYGLANATYRTISNNTLLLNAMTSEEYDEVEDTAKSDTAKLEETNYLSVLNARLQKKQSFIAVREDGVIIYNGSEELSSEELENELPKYGDPGANLKGGVYFRNEKQWMVKQVDYENSDGKECSAFIVTKTDQIAPQITGMVKELGIVIVLILVLTSLGLSFWIYRGVIGPLEQLKKATQNIKDGNLDFTVEPCGVAEINDLCEDFEEMRIRLKETAEEVIFNLDATASRRGGYHMFNEYGNIFLENRYTDWQNYYPYWTLRNLWMLSKYVPAEKLQIEFLNKWRNTDKYKGEVFAPENYSFEYLFATTLAGQPLAWMEGTNLPEEAFTLREHTEAYKKFQHDMHSGTILPIGDEPSGRSWTGFQSLKKDRGYLIVYRENHPEGTTEVETWLPEGVTVRCIPLMGHGKAMTAVTGKKGRLEISLPSINDYVVYKYEIKNKR